MLFVVLLACQTPAASFANAHAVAMCDLYSRCDVLDPLGFDGRDACVSGLRIDARGGCADAFEADAGAACLAALRSVSCAALTDGSADLRACAQTCVDPTPSFQ